MTNSLTSPSPILSMIERAIITDPRLKSAHSIRQYRSHLHRFEAWRDGQPLTLSLVEEYLSLLQKEGKAPDTIRQHHASIRWLARKVSDMAEESNSPEAERIIKQAARIISMRGVESDGQSEQRGRHLDPKELGALLAACDADPSPAGARDKAIIWLAYSNGLRRQTLCDLELSKLERTEIELPGGTESGAKIRYTSKRGKKGTASLFGDVWQAMLSWLAVRGDKPGPIFAQVNKSGKVTIPSKPLSGEAIRLWLDRRAMEAGLSKSTSWHTFRYTFAGNLLDEGYDITTVQSLMLHASPVTTSRYDKRKERHQQEAILSISKLGG